MSLELGDGFTDGGAAVRSIKNEGQGRVTVTGGTTGCMRVQMLPTVEMGIEATKVVDGTKGVHAMIAKSVCQGDSNAYSSQYGNCC